MARLFQHPYALCVSLAFAMLIWLSVGIAYAGGGRITLETGDPSTAGAEVELFGFIQELRYWNDTGHRFKLDTAGKTGIDDLEVDTSHLLRVSQQSRVAYAKCVLLSESPEQTVRVRLEAPVASLARVRNEAGEPIAGARLWQIEHTGTSGEVTLNWKTLEALGFDNKVSDSEGRLPLPPLPPGKVALSLFGGGHAPAEVSGVVIADKPSSDSEAPVVVMPPGVKVRLDIDDGGGRLPIEELAIDLRHEGFRHASTLIGPLPVVRDGRGVELVVAPGRYERLRLNTPGLVVAPIYQQKYSNHGARIEFEPFVIAPGADRFSFQRFPKTTVTGRVVNADSGEPMAEQSIQGETLSPRVDGPFAPFAEEWTHIGWAETNDSGEYQIEVAEGHARVFFHGRGLIADPDSHEVDAAASEPAQAPDFRVRPIPKVRGVVLDQSGDPVADAVVRFRRSRLLHVVLPTVTDAQGRFELVPPWAPTDLATGAPLPGAVVSAFHPNRPAEGAAEVRIDDPRSVASITLRLANQPDFDTLARFRDDLQASERDELPTEKRDEWQATTLVGKRAIKLDGAHWLNTGGRSRSLADYRGRHVLLQFWATWCGPCHRDTPMLKLLDKLYAEHGLTLIGVHDNSMPLDAIEKSIADHDVTWPIVVDHPDGRLFEAYREHGLSGYPSYVLIGPDGVVLQDDETPGAPVLRTYMIEELRRRLLDDAPNARHSP